MKQLAIQWYFLSHSRGDSELLIIFSQSSSAVDNRVATFLFLSASEKS